MTWADVMILMIINQLVTSFIYLSIYVFVTTIKVLILLWFDTWWVCVCVSHSVMFDSFWPHGLWPASLLCPWNSPGKNAGVDTIPFSRGSSWPRDQTQVSCIAGRFFTIWATREAPVFNLATLKSGWNIVLVKDLIGNNNLQSQLITRIPQE